jgi:hypothetical protein
VGVPLHLIDRFSADALEHFPGTSRWSRRISFRFVSLSARASPLTSLIFYLFFILFGD